MQYLRASQGLFLLSCFHTSLPVSLPVLSHSLDRRISYNLLSASLPLWPLCSPLTVSAISCSFVSSFHLVLINSEGWWKRNKCIAEKGFGAWISRPVLSQPLWGVLLLLAHLCCLLLITFQRRAILPLCPLLLHLDLTGFCRSAFFWSQFHPFGE